MIWCNPRWLMDPPSRLTCVNRQQWTNSWFPPPHAPSAVKQRGGRHGFGTLPTGWPTPWAANWPDAGRQMPCNGGITPIIHFSSYVGGGRLGYCRRAFDLWLWREYEGPRWWRMYAPVVPQATNTDPTTYTLCHMVSSMSKKLGDRW